MSTTIESAAWSAGWRAGIHDAMKRTPNIYEDPMRRTPNPYTPRTCTTPGCDLCAADDLATPAHDRTTETGETA